jgi:hypothetical protein
LQAYAASRLEACFATGARAQRQRKLHDRSTGKTTTTLHDKEQGQNDDGFTTRSDNEIVHNVAQEWLGRRLNHKTADYNAKRLIEI